MNLNRHVAIDGQMHFLAGSSSCLNFYKGGHAIEGLVGPRFSVRGGHLAYFGTVKPGFIRWDHALSSAPFKSPADAQFESHTLFALNVGGGVEYEAAPRVRLRAEVGDTILRNTYPDGHLIDYTNNLQIVVGAHYVLGSVLPGHDPRPSGQDTHKFFDTPNLLLTALAVSGIAADAIETQRNFRDCRNALCRSLREGDPLARPFVKYGWSGQIPFSALAAGGELFLCNRLHRAGHHKLERIVPIAVAIGGGVMAYRNAGARSPVTVR